MIEKAHAKINLCLDVKARRSDGYHELDMIMIPLQLHDVLEIEKSDVDHFESNDESVPFDQSHTVIKAYNLMKEQYGINQCVKVKLTKNIPSQAGLAGGSADGAAMVRAMNQLFELQADDEQLAKLCLKIGADVPFCYYQKPSIVQGIGEKIKRFEFLWDPHVLLVKPQMGVSTKDAYQTLNIEACDHLESDLIVDLLQNNTCEHIGPLLKNSLEYSAFRLVPQLKTLKQQIKEQGLDIVLMSGSGSTMFAISEDEQLIEKAYQYFKQDESLFVCKTQFFKA